MHFTLDFRGTPYSLLSHGGGVPQPSAQACPPSVCGFMKSRARGSSLKLSITFRELLKHETFLLKGAYLLGFIGVLLLKHF